MKPLSTSQPLVSVIMPTYNHGRFIGEAIESVINQTYTNFELIIIDNYSEDNTEQIVASYKDERIKYIKFRNNGIIAASRNYGIKIAYGEYIAFLDSDDLWLPTKVKLQLDCLSTQSNVGLVYSKCFVVKNGEICRTAPPLNLYNGYAFNRMIFIPIVPILTTMIRRDVINTIGCFDEDPKLNAVEDQYFFIKLSKMFQILPLENPLAIYRTHSSNLSENPIRQLICCLYLSRKLVKNEIISLSQWIFLSIPGILIIFPRKIVKHWLLKLIKST